jgi:hypothetical protein
MDRYIIEYEDIRSEMAADIDMQATHDPYKEETEIDSLADFWDADDDRDDQRTPAYDSRAGS